MNYYTRWSPKQAPLDHQWMGVWGAAYIWAEWEIGSHIKEIDYYLESERGIKVIEVELSEEMNA